ncbi:hypothetical protein [Pseudonocardia sp. ICBG162]|uniref:hypothetical protein n=1 Tax=Pseudonocardia sp. ICBG162 TaxID=2846761 RepID=UPI001CF6CB76|nr:hypothetical protein [Pseudonocardia sp. ICBG162]
MTIPGQAQHEAQRYNEMLTEAMALAIEADIWSGDPATGHDWSGHHDGLMGVIGPLVVDRPDLEEMTEKAVALAISRVAS